MNRFCMDCRGEWFTLLPLVSEVTGERYGPAIVVDENGRVTAWTGRLQCSSCGRVHGTESRPELPPAAGPRRLTIENPGDPERWWEQ